MKKISLSDIIPVPTSHNKQILKKVIARNGDIPSITQIAQVTLNPGDEVEEHKHDDLYEIFYIESGEGIVTINGTEHQIKPGDVLTIEPLDNHCFKNNQKIQLVVYYFAIKTT